MEILVQLLILGGFIAVLVKSAVFAFESISKFCKITGISELAAGFAIVAVSTSSPEIGVAFFSTISQNIGIALGDIFGSNIVNIALITSLFLLLSPVKKNRIFNSENTVTITACICGNSTNFADTTRK